MIRRGSSRVGCVFPVCSFWWFSEPFSSWFSWSIIRPFSLGFGGGCMLEPFVALFPLIPVPNPWAKGLDFWVFLALGLEAFLVGFLRFLSSWQDSVDQMAMECPWGVPTIPKVLCNTLERFGRSGVGFGGVDPRVLFIPSGPAWPVWPVQRPCGFCLGWTSWWVPCCPELLLFQVLFVLELGRLIWVLWGFVALAGLTGVLHQCDAPGF
jgi:hypothetical protein